MLMCDCGFDITHATRWLPASAAKHVGLNALLLPSRRSADLESAGAYMQPTLGLLSAKHHIALTRYVQLSNPLLAPAAGSFEDFMAAGAKDWYSEQQGAVMQGSAHA
jgi:hypothetical protein